jgi:hypothetical protein
MGAHPDGTGTGWTGVESVDVDRPHGLDYRYSQHIAKALRKRSNKEHVSYGDITAGGEHIPGLAQVLLQVDTTVDLTNAYDNPRDGTGTTYFAENGVAHTDVCFTTTALGVDTTVFRPALWCVTGATGDPTVLLIHPDKQYKSGDITWRGAQEFDGSVDFTGPVHMDGSLDIIDNVDFGSLDDTLPVTVRIHGYVDGTHAVRDRVDFSSAGFSGDVTITGAFQFDGTWSTNGVGRLIGDVTMFGLMSFCSNNVYDSSWFNVALGTAYTKTHDLSSTALLTLLYFKDTANDFSEGINRVYHVSPFLYSNNEGGAEIKNITNTQLTIQVAASYLATTYDSAGNWVFADSGGSMRVIVMRLV